MHGPSGTGLDLTAAVRAAVAEVPVDAARLPRPAPVAVRAAAARGRPAARRARRGSAKFCAYATELDDLRDCRERRSPVGRRWQQTVEAAVMDTADDIAYAIHDLEDFHRVGVLQQAGVAAELIGWQRADDCAASRCGPRRPPTSERLRRGVCATRTAGSTTTTRSRAAVARVRDELVDGLLAVPFDGSMAAERAVAEFSARWTRGSSAGVTVGRDPPVRSAHVVLATAQWHEVAVLKFVHQRFVLRRAGPRLAPARPGDRAGRAGGGAARVARRGRRRPAPAAAAARPGRALPWPSSRRHRAAGPRPGGVDYVASLTDGQATALLDVLTGRSGRLWTDAPAP